MKTTYVPMKRCMNCWKVNHASLNSCSECGHLMVREASNDEVQAAVERFSVKFDYEEVE